MTIVVPALRAALSPSWSKNELWRRARAIPSLDLRFADNKSLVDATTGAQLVTFTRASSATYVDSEGVIRPAVTNLLLRSEEFENASWTLTRMSAFGSGSVANAIAAPNGTITAEKVVEDTTASNTHLVQQLITVASGVQFTGSIYAKAAERNWILFNTAGTPFGTNGQYVDLSNGSLGNAVGTVDGFSVTPVGDGWYRIRWTATTTGSGNGGIQVRLATGNGGQTYTGDGTSGIYLWGAQLEQSSTVGEYIPTTSTINSAPRFDHNPVTGESLGLLVEEARTNSIRNNTMVGAVAGTPGTLPTNWFTFTSLTGLTQQIVGTGTENGIAYIDYKLSGTASGGGAYNLFLEALGQVVAAESQVWTTSSYFKLAGGSLSNITDIRIASQSRTAGGSFIAQYSSVATVGSTLTRAANTSSALPATTERIVPLVIFTIASAAAIDITLRIGLPQLELGAFATSVIPTSTAAATRSADVASIPSGSNFSGWFNPSQGTILGSSFVNAKHGGVNSFPRTSSITDGTSANRIDLFNRVLTSYTDAGYSVVASSGVQAAFETNNERNGQSMSVGYAVDNFGFAVGGTLADTDTSGTLPTVDRLIIGNRLDSGSYLNGTIRRLTYWPQRLPNSTLQAITQ